jgi:hypothetical protein
MVKQSRLPPCVSIRSLGEGGRKQTKTALFISFTEWLRYLFNPFNFQ